MQEGKCNLSCIIDGTKLMKGYNLIKINWPVKMEGDTGSPQVKYNFHSLTLFLTWIYIEVRAWIAYY